MEIVISRTVKNAVHVSFPLVSNHRCAHSYRGRSASEPSTRLSRPFGRLVCIHFSNANSACNFTRFIENPTIRLPNNDRSWHFVLEFVWIGNQMVVNHSKRIQDLNRCDVLVGRLAIWLFIEQQLMMWTQFHKRGFSPHHRCKQHSLLECPHYLHFSCVQRNPCEILQLRCHLIIDRTRILGPRSYQSNFFT